MGTVGFGLTQMLMKRRDGQQSVNDVISQPIGNITSRDQIINPDDLVNPAFYANTRAGRAQYESDRQAAIYYAQQQEAAFQEWYNSTEQQVIRDRQAGLNPDLNGLSDSAPASDTNPVESSPMQGLPTNGQMALDALNLGFGALSSIANVFSVVGQLRSLSAQSGMYNAQADLAKVQTDNVYLSNIDNFKRLASSAISDKLAQAISSSDGDFDISQFFAGDFSDIKKSLSPSSDPRYDSAFSNVLSDSQKTLSDAYTQLATSEEGRSKFLSRLASKYYSHDDDVMLGQLKVIVNAREEVEMIALETDKKIKEIVRRYSESVNPEAAASAFNAQNEYDTSYIEAMNAEVMAVLDAGIKQSQHIIQGANADVYKYLRGEFGSDKSFSNPVYRQQIGWTILAGANMGWQDFLLASGSQFFLPIINSYNSEVYKNFSYGENAYYSSEAQLMNADANLQNAATNRVNAVTNGVNAMTNLVNLGFRPQVNK